jgi:hypothetical protein
LILASFYEGPGFDSQLTVPGGNIPKRKTDQVKVSRSLGQITRFRLPLGVIGMPATWVDHSLSRDNAATHKDLQHLHLVRVARPLTKKSVAQCNMQLGF